MAKRAGRFILVYAALAIAAFSAAAVLSGCGYSLQRSRNTELEKTGIRTIYIEPLTNNTYKVGIENIVYNALVKALQTYKSVRIVEKREFADAVLSGMVTGAAYSNSASTTIKLRGTDLSFASQYTAVLSTTFTLARQANPALKREAKTLWTSSFGRSQNFQANNQLGIYGTTSPLINDSEFDRVLREMADNMMADLNESMLAMF